MQLGQGVGHTLMARFVLSVLISAAGTVSADEGSSAQSQPGTPEAAVNPTGSPAGGVRAKAAPNEQQMAAAKEFFERGKALFIEGQYDAAWVEFSSAYQLVELPDLLFNMARAEERMDRPADAAKHYREFLTKSPDDPDAAKIRANIALLEQKAALHPQPPPRGQDQPRRFPIYSTIAGGGTLLFAIIGAAALGTATAKYNGLANTCAPTCSMTEALSLKPTYQTGQAFLTLAAIGAAGTAGLLVWELRRGHRERGLAALPAPLSQTAHGSY